MPNIASVLKSEISRIARREVGTETWALQKAASAARSEIAALKRRTQALEQQLRRMGKATALPVLAAETDAPSVATRFSAKGLASQRCRLGLSAADCGLLLGAAPQSVYNWESGKSRPSSAYLNAISALKAMSKTVALARLASLKTQGRKP